MATVKDVARRAGVSTATVSRVLNNKGQVSATARAKVLAAVEALNFKPSRVARNLRVRRTQLIGLIISDIQNPFFAWVTRGVEDAAYQNGYSLILCNSNEDPTRERMYLEVMHAEEVAGVILATTQDTGHDRTLLCGPIPTVAVDRTIDDLEIDTVVVDNVRGAYEAVAHLLRSGHRRIGLIAGPPRLSTARERQQGYEQAHNDFDIPVDPALVRHGNFKQDSGYEHVRDLLTHPKQPTALFVANNLMTLGALNAIHELGLRIPDEVAIVGFDDMPWAMSLNPPLTVVAQPHYELGRAAADLLLRRLTDREASAIHVCLPPTLIIRESSCAQVKTSP
ncbi:MAG: LacI family transcriptional regulator [Ardenticatenaceae bacterium]|nr:LacI family transcriptional regulator [Ardenticatenaceae bacterium]HBY92559.1 LacI family transcriptional regulator [Chloroflexota bacterium]